MFLAPYFLEFLAGIVSNARIELGFVRVVELEEDTWA